MLTEKSCSQEAVIFLNKLFSDLEKTSIQLREHWDIDHLCYRCESEESYQELKKSFSSFADILVESPVNGRLIATFKLKKPISYRGYFIDIIELPAPKVNKVTNRGFEHAEVVCDWSFSKIKKHYPNIKFDEAGSTKKINADIEMCFSESNLKFHHLSLESVIRLESHVPLWSALEKLNLLNLLAEYHPLIAGTFPLGITSKNSDVDIILEANSLTAISAHLYELFHLNEKFELKEKLIKSIPSVICHFLYEGLSFEIFAQKKEVLKQDAYQHFLIEEKLLKRGGDSFKNTVIELKEKGRTTEQAFAEVLKIKKCPYESLKELQQTPLGQLDDLLGT